LNNIVKHAAVEIRWHYMVH